MSLSYFRSGGNGPVVYIEGRGSMLHAGARVFSDPWQSGFGWWLTVKLRGRYLLMKSGGPANRIGRQGEPDYRVMWEEAARHALIWRARFETLSDAVDEYHQVTPGRAGYAAARRELLRVWLSVDDPDVGER